MEQRFIEIDATDEDFMLYLFDSGMFGDIQTDNDKIILNIHLMQNFFPNVPEDVIKMCTKWYLENIKKNKSLCDAEIMYQLGKQVSSEIKDRWL